MGRAADACQSTAHDDSGSYYGGDSEVKVTRQVTGALRRPQHGIRARSDTISKGAAYQLATARQSLAGSDLEPARLETTGGVPRDVASKPATSRPDKNLGTSTETSKTSARKRTRRSPMLTHETSPVSGASVMGMTYGACQGPSYLPAGVPGVSTALEREDRPKGRLRQQPAGDSTEESQSRAMKTKALQWLDRRKWPGPDKIDRGKGRE
jgi:hypothetical protein